MKDDKLLKLITEGNISFSLYFLKNYKKLNMSAEEFLFIMYLYNQGSNSIFNPNKIEEDLNISLEEVMGYISSLTEKKLLLIDTIKNDKGLLEEIINIDDFYAKLVLSVKDDSISMKNDHSNSNIFDVIEKEFGRTLSPMEYEIIKAWLDSGISEDLIGSALKEATFNGVSNLRYIDKILYEWGKNGIKNSNDVNNAKRKRKDTPLEDNSDIFEYDWFDDND